MHGADLFVEGTPAERRRRAQYIARDRAAAAAIKHAFTTKDRVHKQYLAVVHGQPLWDDEHTIDLPLRVAQPGDSTRLTHVRMLAVPGGLPAITHVRVECRTADHALVRCGLVTGRQYVTATVATPP